MITELFSPYNLSVATIIVYCLASLVGLSGLALKNGFFKKTGCYLALGAFFCQTLILILGYHKQMPTGLSFGVYLQLMAWFFLLCGIGAWWRLREDALLLFAALAGFILFLISMPSLQAVIRLPAYLSTPFYILHIGAMFLGLGLLFVAFIASLIFLSLQKRIKRKKKLAGFWSQMPSLVMLDKINSACVLAAFPLYSIGLFFGFFWAAPISGSFFSGDPKEIASLAIWLLLAILFHNRLAKNWKGRKPAIYIIIIFSLSLISILAVNFLLSSYHGLIRS